MKFFSTTAYSAIHHACYPAVAAYFCTGLAAFAAQASPPVPYAMATQPDPRDFVTRSETTLSALGDPLRFGGFNISWLGVRSDNGRPEDARIPTDFEITDVIGTVQAMGSGFVRSTSLASSAGCAQCLVPGVGQTNPEAFRHVDHVLRMLRDAGMKVVLPLAGSGNCPPGGPVDPVAGSQCVFARARGLPDAAFYTDPQVRADFARHVTMLLNHLNPETGLTWKDDPTIAAWENCDDCGAGIDPGVMAEWTEFLGQTIKALDTHHVYENGAFAGRLGHKAGTVAAALLAQPSVDIIGDTIAPAPGAAPDLFADAQDAVTKAGRIYMIDNYAWAPAHWTTVDDLEAFLNAVVKDRAVAGAFVSELGGHADQGGWLPPTRPDMVTLYFPTAPISQVDAATMETRARAVRRFVYGMLDLLSPAFATPSPPEIISVEHGRVRWRGTAGATVYSISRSSDLDTIGSWDMPCDKCASDQSPVWQDPAVPAGAVWYRITPYNANLHAGLPSKPVQSK